MKKTQRSNLLYSHSTSLAWEITLGSDLHSGGQTVPHQQKNDSAEHWWQMPVILTTWNAEIRRTAVQSQPSNSLQDHILKIPRTCTHTCTHMHTHGWQSGSSCSAWLESEKPSSNTPVPPKKKKKERETQQIKIEGTRVPEERVLAWSVARC
jgi:hypothetical protein